MVDCRAVKGYFHPESVKILPTFVRFAEVLVDKL